MMNTEPQQKYNHFLHWVEKCTSCPEYAECKKPEREMVASNLEAQRRIKEEEAARRELEEKRRLELKAEMYREARAQKAEEERRKREESLENPERMRAYLRAIDDAAEKWVKWWHIRHRTKLIFMLCMQVVGFLACTLSEFVAEDQLLAFIVAFGALAFVSGVASFSEDLINNAPLGIAEEYKIKWKRYKVTLSIQDAQNLKKSLYEGNKCLLETWLRSKYPDIPEKEYPNFVWLVKTDHPQSRKYTDTQVQSIMLAYIVGKHVAAWVLLAVAVWLIDIGFGSNLGLTTIGSLLVALSLAVFFRIL